MPSETRYPHAEALAVAQELLAVLAPACTRIEIAGSIRRRRPDCGDIELLAIPKPTDDLFYVDELDRAVKGLLGASPPILAMRPSVKGVTTYGPKNKLLIHLPSGIPLDLFSTTMEYYGMSLVVRTGSAQFNIRMMARFKQLRMQGHAYGGITSAGGQEIECRDEETVFRNLGWEYLEPWDRT